MTKRKAWKMQAAAGDRGEVTIYDVIGDPWDGTTAKGFAADLKGLGAVRDLDVYVNSPGGYVFDAVAIYNQLVRHRARVTMNIDGLAASAASVIAMAGNQINIALNGMMMIHDPWVFAMGSAPDLRRQADMLDNVRGTILDTYVARTGGDEGEISEMMAEETWFGAEDAVRLGFADEITGEVDLAQAAAFDLSKFDRAPERLIKAIKDARPDPALPIVTEDFPTEQRTVVADAPADPVRLELASRSQRLRKLGIGSERDRLAEPAAA